MEGNLKLLLLHKTVTELTRSLAKATMSFTLTLKLMTGKEIKVDAMTDASTVTTPLASFQDDRLALVDR